MKTIGLIGGMSWESTVTYYQLLNEGVKEKLGGLHSAKILLHSVDFYEIETCQRSGDWERCGRELGQAAANLEAAGAEMILICTNTMHKVYEEIQARVQVPVLHIARAAAAALREKGYTKAALLGTRFTMEGAFYKDKLTEAGVEVLTPTGEDAALVDRVIFEELCLGELKESSRREYVRIIETLQQQGAQAVILGCTEIGLLVGEKDTDLPVFDTTVIHVEAALKEALREE